MLLKRSQRRFTCVFCSVRGLTPNGWTITEATVKRLPGPSFDVDFSFEVIVVAMSKSWESKASNRSGRYIHPLKPELTPTHITYLSAKWETLSEAKFIDPFWAIICLLVVVNTPAFALYWNKQLHFYFRTFIHQEYNICQIFLLFCFWRLP